MDNSKLILAACNVLGRKDIFACYEGSTPIIKDSEGNPLPFDQVAIENEIAVLFPPAPKRYSKKKLFEVMTVAEYDTFETTEAQQPKKDRRMFSEAQELNESDPSFPQFSSLMKQFYGEVRAAELLALAEVS